MKSTGIVNKLVASGAVLLVIWGAWLRFAPLSTEPYWMDEGYTINAVTSYRDGHRDRLAAVLDSGQHYECFLYCYPTALITRTFGESAVSYRILSMVFGLMSVLAIYLTTRLLYPRSVALLAAFFTLFGYFEIAWSTNARWYTMLTAFFWLGLAALIAFLKTPPTNTTRQTVFALATIASTILAILAHKFAILLPFIIVFTLAIYQYTTKRTLRTVRPRLGLALATGGTVLALMVYMIFRTQFVTGITFHYNLSYYLSFLLRNYWPMILFAIYALATAARRETWMALIFVTYLAPLAFLTTIVHYRYIFHVTPVLFILAAVGVYRISESLPARLPYRTAGTVAAAIVLFFVAGTGTFLPHDRYWLESDDPSTVGDRPSYAYTPQPDWNAAYQFVRLNRTPGDTIISTQPPLTKLFLHEPGYWIYYDYLGLDNRTQYRTADNREFYVGATIIDDLDTLKSLTTTTHGYLIYDYMSADGRISPDILDYITNNLTKVFEKVDNSYSKVWVYRF